MKRYLYKIINNINQRFYIGVHVSRRSSDRYMGSGKSIKTAIAKYGKENFTKIILEYFDSEEEMFSREREVVNEEFVANPETYNMIVGGKGTGSGSNHPLYGKKRPEHSEFMRANSPTKGKLCPQSTKDAISKANKGRKHSAEVNKKKGQVGNRNYFFGKRGTATDKKWINNGEESKLVINPENFLELGWKMGRIVKISKQVCKLDKISMEIMCEYTSLKEAGLINNVSKNSISNCCNGRLKSAGGYIWKFK